jgi:hypothetical protein
MSAIVEIQERIQSTVARIAEYEKAALLPGAPQSLLVGIRSLEKLKAELERDFERIAASDEIEVCRYRLIPSLGQRPTLGAIANAWDQFQLLFSSVYDAVKNGPPVKRAAKRSLLETQFALGFVYSGSIGAVLTLPTKQITNFAAHDLEKTNNTIFEMAKAQSAEQLSQFVERIGVPPVMKFGKWVDAHVGFAAGAGIEWSGPARETIAPLLVQLQEFVVLQKALHTISEPTEVEGLVTGMLIGAWLRNHKFEMELDSGELLSGRFGDAITPQHAATLPRRYVARVRTTKTINPATEHEAVSQFLVELVRELPI